MKKNTGAGYPAALLVVVVHTLDVDLVQGRHRCNCPRRGSCANRGRRDRGRRRSARHGDATARRRGLRKGRGARLRNGANVAVPILRHTDTEVPDGDGQVHPLGGDFDGMARVSLNLLEVGDALVVAFAQRIRFDPLASAPNSTAGALADNHVC